MLLISLRSSHL